MSKTLIKIKIRDTENIIFQGTVDRISSFNEVGPFDVYPTHANFISILRQKITLYKDREKIKELDVEQAVMKVKQDAVNIFLGIEAFMLEEPENNKNIPSKKK
jgi:F0F1-type ATP synthase epsilon subunit